MGIFVTRGRKRELLQEILEDIGSLWDRPFTKSTMVRSFDPNEKVPSFYSLLGIQLG